MEKDNIVREVLEELVKEIERKYYNKSDSAKGTDCQDKHTYTETEEFDEELVRKGADALSNNDFSTGIISTKQVKEYIDQRFTVTLSEAADKEMLQKYGVVPKSVEELFDLILKTLGTSAEKKNAHAFEDVMEKMKLGVERNYGHGYLGTEDGTFLVKISYVDGVFTLDVSEVVNNGGIYETKLHEFTYTGPVGNSLCDKGCAHGCKTGKCTQLGDELTEIKEQTSKWLDKVEKHLTKTDKNLDNPTEEKLEIVRNYLKEDSFADKGAIESMSDEELIHEWRKRVYK